MLLVESANNSPADHCWIETLGREAAATGSIFGYRMVRLLHAMKQVHVSSSREILVLMSCQLTSPRIIFRQRTKASRLGDYRPRM